MKVLAVLAICLHIATCRFHPDMHMEHEMSSGINNTCVNFNQLVWNQTHQALFDRSDVTREIEIQILINEFSQAALKCIPNNRVYRNVHVILDDLNSLIERFPSRKNVQKRIAEAQDYMDEHFDDLHPVQYKFPHLRNRIGEFFKEYSRRAASVFKRVLINGNDASSIFRKIDLFHATRDIVRQVNDCLALRPTEIESIFKCRERVRSLASDVPRLVEDLLNKIQKEMSPHSHRIDGLLANFAIEKKEIEGLIKKEEMERKFGINHRD